MYEAGEVYGESQFRFIETCYNVDRIRKVPRHNFSTIDTKNHPSKLQFNVLMHRCFRRQVHTALCVCIIVMHQENRELTKQETNTHVSSDTLPSSAREQLWLRSNAMTNTYLYEGLALQNILVIMK